MLLRTLVAVALLAAPFHAAADVAAPVPSLDSATHPAEAGVWGPLVPWPTLAEYSALLPTGRVLSFLGGPDATLWDPATGDFESIPLPDGDMHCPGLTLLDDGRLLVMGGHNPTWHGTPRAWTFDPWTREWTRLDDMHVGRYYPAAVTLADGRALVVSGNAPDGKDASTPEAWSDATGWTLLDTATLPMEFYPRLHVMADGRVARTGQDASLAIFDPETATWSDGPSSSFGRRWGGGSVMLEADKVLVFGGGSLGFSSEGGADGTFFRDPAPDVLHNIVEGALQGPYAATASAEILDLSTQPPTWSPAASMLYPRRDHAAVGLPDGTVLAIGGGVGFEPLPGWPISSIQPELYEPTSGSWRALAPPDVHRGYHQVALLLPDATVLSAGGDFEFGQAVTGFDHTGQVFAPPYLFRGPRPTIAEAPQEIARGATLAAVVSNMVPVDHLSLVRLGTSTHSINNDQRTIALPTTLHGATATATLPAEPGALPPGWYMLFAISEAGVPSVARMLRIVP